MESLIVGQVARRLLGFALELLHLALHLVLINRVLQTCAASLPSPNPEHDLGQTPGGHGVRKR
jgi:hypothetical protein